MSKKDKVIKFSLRLPEEIRENLGYWADRREVSINDYILDAINRQIAYENKDYDLPTAEVARMNQLIDLVVSLSANIQSLENVTTSGFDSLLGLTRGDNYLLEQDEV